jgi:predicted component of type VI protein secretion system
VIVSPCLSEAALMSRVLESRAYVAWLDRVLPPLQSGRFAPLTEAIAIPTAAPPPQPPAAAAGAPIDTTPAGRAATAAAAAAALANEHARLAGLSFSRAQSMERIARALPATDPRVAAWHRLSAIQAERGFELMRDDQAGLSWLPAQALLYMKVRQ